MAVADQAAQQQVEGIEAEYVVEQPVRCSSCDQQVERLHVLRLLRTKVNFTSSAPRRGFVVVCPSCRAILSANFGSMMGL